MSQQQEPTPASAELINPGVTIFYTDNNPNERRPEWDISEQVTCPACECKYVHMRPPSFVDGQDDHKAWKGRGDLVVVPMSCERGHAWEFCFGFHKGGTYGFIRNLTTMPESEFDPDVDEDELELEDERES